MHSVSHLKRFRKFYLILSNTFKRNLFNVSFSAGIELQISYAEQTEVEEFISIFSKLANVIPFEDS